jgi:hypothetical protein
MSLTVPATAFSFRASQIPRRRESIWFAAPRLAATASSASCSVGRTKEPS